MLKIGIGCDIINIERISRLYKEYGARFVQRILAQKEIEHIFGYTTDESLIIGYIAKRYAAKEAYAKAVGSGIREEVCFRAIEVLNDESGRPYFNKVTSPYIADRTYLSLADDFPFAIAYVLIDKSKT